MFRLDYGQFLNFIYSCDILLANKKRPIGTTQQLIFLTFDKICL